MGAPSSIEKLAVAQAFYSKVGEMVSTKAAGNLRAEVDAEFAELYEQMAAHGAAPKSFDITVDGQKVGTYSITANKPEPGAEYDELRVVDKKAYQKWALDEGFAHYELVIEDEMVQEHFRKTGEVPDGAEIRHVVKPEIMGGGIARTTVRVDPAKVAAALGPRLGGTAAALLTEGGV